jgi:hypothetical protein
MNALNIKYYNLLRNDLHIADDKALDFVQVSDDLMQYHIKNAAVEFKSLVKEDFSRLDADIKKLDSKIDLKVSELRTKIKDSKVDTIKWMIGIFIALALMIMGLYIKK